MFAYCNNTSPNTQDPSGCFLEWLIPLFVIPLLFSGCEEKSSPGPLPYSSPDKAAEAFSEEIYASSLYIRHEYSAVIYEKEIDGVKSYNYTKPLAGLPHGSAIRPSNPSGTAIVAIIHTHPNSTVFSSEDIETANRRGNNSYVIGPDYYLQLYDVKTKSITIVASITPRPLSQEQKNALVDEFRYSWETHISDGCDWGCELIVWPTP